MPTTAKLEAPYGSWASRITSDTIVAATIGLSDVMVDGDDIYWLESRPLEAGRVVIVRQSAGTTEDVLPAPFNARSRVHEYGGGAAMVHEKVCYFVNFRDQQLYQYSPGTVPVLLTNEPECRYADMIMDGGRRHIICVREQHVVEGGVHNALVLVSLEAPEVRVIAEGHDFYSSPRLSSDGKRLTWLAWNHPHMPWTGTELWVAEVASDGTLQGSRMVAGGPEESVFQPEWSPNNILHFISDRTGWWNLYQLSEEGVAKPLWTLEAEFGQAQWTFGMSTYAFLPDSTLVATYSQRGHTHLVMLRKASGNWDEMELPYKELSSIRAGRSGIVMQAAAPNLPVSILQVDPSTRNYKVLRRSTEILEDGPLSSYVSIPESIEFPTERGLTAYALYYTPNNPNFAAPEGALPPLIVKSHGGPTAAASSALDLRIQYWTSRGFAFIDVDYGGSTGYGRDYRERLHLRWGIVDVEDCVNAAKFLIDRGDIDAQQVAITGGSAGGYTTLCALVFRNFFKIGASYYGIGDLEVLARDTHKFESRYLDWLIGKYPEEQNIYQQRSPVHFVDGLSVPVAFFQGELDEVVPPNQSQIMVDAIRKKNFPVTYLLFADESHGFRRAESIKRSLDAELHFYSTLMVRNGLRF